MERKRLNRIKWILGVVLLLHLCCFFPGDMIPLPLAVYEFGIIESAFTMDFDRSGFGSKLTLIGQLGLIWALFLKGPRRIVQTGQISILLLMIGIPLLMNYRNVHGWTFEFGTWIPFYIVAILYLYLGSKWKSTKNYSQQPI